MDQRISISLGVGMLGLVAWTALGNGASALPSVVDESSLPVSLDSFATGDQQTAGDQKRADDRHTLGQAAPSADAQPVMDSETNTDGQPSTKDTDIPNGLPAPSTDTTGDTTGTTPAQPNSVPSPPSQPASPQNNHNRRFNNPDAAFTPRGRRGQMGSILGPGGLAGQGRSGFSEEEVDRARQEADEFWQRNSPERFKAMQSLTTGLKAAMQNATTRMYLGFKQIAQKDPQLYDVIVRRVQAEDIVFDLVASVKKSGQDAKSSKPLRDAVEALVKLNLKERRMRLDQLAKTLKDQQDALKSDEDPANFGNLVEKRLDTEINQRQYPNHPRNRPGVPPVP